MKDKSAVKFKKHSQKQPMKSYSIKRLVSSQIPTVPSEYL